ncbi:MAG: AmmeMemoRadiSam system protein B [Bacteroidetes bacterium]|nr:AmmeMemoRadiSam system protein B [Bacteroidota bacterium]
MKRGITVLLFIILIMETNAQNKQVDRQPVAAGRFYSAGQDALLKDISKLFEECKKSDHKLDVRAIVSPHAGYVFSGKIAAAAFSSVTREKKIRNVFIIASSHVMAFDGASVYNTGDYITPLGKIHVNFEIAEKLKNESSVFNFPTTAHLKEHSIEVQIPLIQYYFKSRPSIVPVIIGTTNDATIKKIAEALRPWFTDENLFVISSDFSHYPGYSDAISADNATATGLISGDPQIFLKSIKNNSSKKIDGLVTSMCGWTSGLTLLYLSEPDNTLTYKILDYMNSGDSEYGDKDRVVGYTAIAVYGTATKKINRKEESGSISFSESEKMQLFEIVRKSISSKLNYGNIFKPDTKGMSDNLKKNYGAFVTLKINGNLRGCIGRFISDDPLYEVVKASAISSAFEDPRFPPLTGDEYKKASIEITVLGPLQRITDPEEIVLGKHGIYIKKDFRSGTMLPQVAIEQGWTVEQFLGYTSRDKAGIGWDGWKSAELFVYEGVVLEENDK